MLAALAWIVFFGMIGSDRDKERDKGRGNYSEDKK